MTAYLQEPILLVYCALEPAISLWNPNKEAAANQVHVDIYLFIFCQDGYEV